VILLTTPTEVNITTITIIQDQVDSFKDQIVILHCQKISCNLA